MAGTEDVPVPQDYKLDLLRKKYLLQTHAEGADEAVLRYDIEYQITAHDAGPLYAHVCKELQWEESAGRLVGLQAAAAAKLSGLDAAVAAAEETDGEMELRAALVAKAEYLADTGDAAGAAAAFDAAERKTAGAGPKLDLVLARARLELGLELRAELRRTLDRARALSAAGGDWERRNKLKVYEAVEAMATRRFDVAAKLLLDCIATFSATEVMSYEQCVFYTVLTAVLTLDRPSLKAKVISSPEVLSVIDTIPHLSSFLNALHDCKYAEFFRAFSGLLESVRTDPYLHPHYRFFMREVRAKAYSQFLESYKSVTLDSMARAFGVSSEFIDEELANFIVRGQVAARIDRVAGVVQTTRPDAKNGLYQQTIKRGDAVLSRMQNLSKIIDVD
ncbi:RPN7 [Auxenochlorella protothecoides x Auxenochlorella symbiontica]